MYRFLINLLVFLCIQSLCDIFKHIKTGQMNDCTYFLILHKSKVVLHSNLFCELINSKISLYTAMVITTIYLSIKVGLLKGTILLLSKKNYFQNFMKKCIKIDIQSKQKKTQVFRRHKMLKCLNTPTSTNLYYQYI